MGLGLGPAVVRAEDAAPPMTVVDFTSKPSGLTSSSAQVTTEAKPDPSSAATPCLWITIASGNEGYPGVKFAPPGGNWDLSKYGHIQMRVTNTSEKKSVISLRVDNPDDWKLNPWNAENLYLEPGASGDLKVYFGYSFGKPGWKLRPENISSIQVFTGKVAEGERSFRIEKIEAAGLPNEGPPINPANIRIVPKDGFMVGGAAEALKPDQLEGKGGATLNADVNKVKVELTSSKDSAGVIKPPKGRWDLRQGNEVVLKVRNNGSVPVTPKVALSSNGGPTSAVTSAAPIAPGATADVAVTFLPRNPTALGPSNAGAGKKVEALPDTGTKFTSDTISGIRITSVDNVAANLTIESARLETKIAQLPDWLGKRPPVPGDWVPTFTEEFDGKELDASLWHVKGPNYYDKRSAYSPNNLVLKDGTASLRYEKKKSFHNDDPKNKEFEYTTGYLSSYGKWVQRYGYFECRLKPPTAPGLWPAFWLMPDRGLKHAPEQWKRAATENGGMEFDIYEALTRWGPHRYNVAMHWDGYGKNHKAAGSTAIYVQPDKDGFLTCGLLWLPGEAVFYCNGIEVLRWKDERVSNVESNLLFTLPSGGWDNNALDDKQLPADFVLDYVRVWQRKDLASPVDGKQVAPEGSIAQ